MAPFPGCRWEWLASGKHHDIRRQHLGQRIGSTSLSSMANAPTRHCRSHCCDNGFWWLTSA